MKINNALLTGLNSTEHLFIEINGQPNLWQTTYENVLANKNKITGFLEGILKIENLQIILTGAGSSAFVGEILQQSFYKNTRVPTKAIATTDLVTHPEGYFQKSTPTLLVSFARSGDSPESIATFELAEKLHDTIYHLIITCNPEGGLAKMAYGRKNSFILSMPGKANDLALAMTGSFTSMVLAGLLISDIENIRGNEETVKGVIEFGKTILKKYSSKLSEVAELDFKRVVFLGSGAFKGAARESHLKILELTDGKIICQYDSFLGFRHGPRAIIDESTLLIYLFSKDPYVCKYEVDLVKSINSKDHFLFSIGIGQCLAEFENLDLNLTIDPGCEGNKISDDIFTICSVMPAQILGFYKSLSFGLTPDSPSQNGGINRIVQGVNIYRY
ncbi:MAG: SIS domain-containing protein [Ginsengibacter sp.]